MIAGQELLLREEVLQPDALIAKLWQLKMAVHLRVLQREHSEVRRVDASARLLDRFLLV